MRDLAIINTHSNVASVSRENGILQGFDKDYNIVTLDENKVSIEESRLEKEYSDNEYARNRASAYDSIGNQLDMLMKDMRDGTTTHQESCEAVKTRFPKPE